MRIIPLAVVALSVALPASSAERYRAVNGRTSRGGSSSSSGGAASSGGSAVRPGFAPSSFSSGPGASSFATGISAGSFQEGLRGYRVGGGGGKRTSRTRSSPNSVDVNRSTPTVSGAGGAAGSGGVKPNGSPSAETVPGGGSSPGPAGGGTTTKVPSGGSSSSADTAR